MIFILRLERDIELVTNHDSCSWSKYKKISRNVNKWTILIKIDEEKFVDNTIHIKVLNWPTISEHFKCESCFLYSRRGITITYIVHQHPSLTNLIKQSILARQVNYSHYEISQCDFLTLSLSTKKEIHNMIMTFFFNYLTANHQSFLLQ